MAEPATGEAALTAGSRWRGPAVPWAAALLLAPDAPSRVRLLPSSPETTAAWEQAVGWWGLERDPVPRPGALVLAASPRQAVDSGADSLLLEGTDAQGALAAAGYRTRSWSALPWPAGAVLLAADADGKPERARPSSARARARASAVAAVRRAGGTARLTVASRTTTTPALAALLGVERTWVVAGGGGPRRRPVLLAPAGSGRDALTVMKVARREDASRGTTEQGVLTRLRQAGLSAHLPTPLGEGLLGPFAWSSESALSGRPLADLLAEPSSGSRARRVLEQVGAWLGELGRATRTPGIDPGAVALLGEHATPTPHLAGLDDVPGVLVHGDLAAGVNLLADDGSWGVLDWETARPSGPPLLDLLPLLCGSLATRHAPGDARRQAEHVVRLCTGAERDSDWLLRQVAGYLRAVGVPLDRAGALAGLVFRYQASMRLVHEELVRAAGDEPPQWESLWDEVARRWTTDAGLGSEWRALSDCCADPR